MKLFSLKKGKPPFVMTWMELEDVMLRETRKTQKDKYCMISPICGI